MDKVLHKSPKYTMSSKYNDHISDITPGPNEYKVNIDASYAVYNNNYNYNSLHQNIQWLKNIEVI